MRLINTMFTKDANPTKTYAGALKRIERLVDGACDEIANTTFAIVPIDGGFIPVAYVNDRNGWALTVFIANKICTVN